MKILIVRVGRTGDMVMITPAFSALLDKYPDAEFTLLTSPEGKRTLFDFSDKIESFQIYRRKKLFSLMERGAIKKIISKRQFDHIYCFENNSSYYRLFSQSKAQVHDLRSVKGKKHYAQLCLDLISNGSENTHGFFPLYLPVDKATENKTRAYLNQFGITERSFLLAIHPTFSGAEKRLRTIKHKKNKLWPPESFGELSYRLRIYAEKNHIDLRIIMNLMPEQCRFGRKIVQYSRGSVEILSPTPDFQAYKAFLKRANLLLTPDTGPMHIAAALGTSVVALFAGKDPEDCGPFVPETKRMVLRAEETVFPERGIAAISVDDVYEACIKWIG
ncbi:glycosyltransferase family 9 protein [Nitrospira defluvii]|nr:glycosyltransferase family 9 protein [Nitrospira defluvii]